MSFSARRRANGAAAIRARVRANSPRAERRGVTAALLVLACAVLLGSCGRHRAPVARVPSPPSTTAPAPAPPATRPPVLPPGTPLKLIEEGTASWYGVPYHGRRSSNGEIYDMHKLTAAHRTLPFETWVRVTNLRNGKTTDVRITDRGPFIEGRIIDLSFGAAKEIDMVAAGIARVRLEFLGGPPPLAEAFTVQVGAFANRDNAVRMRQSLERKYQPCFVFEYDSPKGLLYRVRVGRVPTTQAAERLAAKLRDQEQLSATFVVRLDENN